MRNSEYVSKKKIRIKFIKQNDKRHLHPQHEILAVAMIGIGFLK